MRGVSQRFWLREAAKGLNKAQAIEAGGILMRALTAYYAGDQLSG